MERIIDPGMIEVRDEFPTEQRNTVYTLCPRTSSWRGLHARAGSGTSPRDVRAAIADQRPNHRVRLGEDTIGTGPAELRRLTLCVSAQRDGHGTHSLCRQRQPWPDRRRPIRRQPRPDQRRPIRRQPWLVRPLQPPLTARSGA